MPDYPLLPLPGFDRGDSPNSSGFSPPTIKKPSVARQRQRLGHKFKRLWDVLRTDRDGVSLRLDPSSIAPERALVLEVAGSLRDFYALTRHTPGLEFLADQEIAFQPDSDFFEIDSRKDREGQARTDRAIGGHVYLAMPDIQALRQLLSLWRRWNRGEALGDGRTQWRDLFQSLLDIRPWGPADRTTDDTLELLREQLGEHSAPTFRIEAELWFHESATLRRIAYSRFAEVIHGAGGTIVDHSTIEAIRYEAALIDVPISEIELVLGHQETAIALCDCVMFLRAQSSIDVPDRSSEGEVFAGDSGENPNGLPPVAALIDGVPIQNHRLLDGRLEIDDPDNLEALSEVTGRYHGTSMASLIIHGDTNLEDRPITRKLHLRPMLYAPGNGGPEHPRQDRLFVDAVYSAVRRMKEGEDGRDPTAPNVFLINISLGDARRPFSGPISPWARLLDYLAEQYGLLFLVSAGNIRLPLPISEFSDWTSFESASLDRRQKAMLQALSDQRAYRTLLSPAEALNVITVGASHDDSEQASRGVAAVDPYGNADVPNMSSALGLGYRKVVKPDIHLPGGREHVRFQTSGEILTVVPGGRYGLKAAAPDAAGNLNRVDLTPGTSAATALATRAAHRIFETFMDADGGSMHLDMNPRFYAVVTKALLVHRSGWGGQAELLEDLYGPHGRGKHVERRDNIARLLGFGFPNVEDAMECSSNRATLAGHGTISGGDTNVHRIPLPPSLENVAEPRTVTVTVAWFSPINPRHQMYRCAKLEVGSVKSLNTCAGVERMPIQPADKSVPRGTVSHTRYFGTNSIPFIDDGHILLRIFCREQAGSLDQPIDYGVAVTIEADEGIPVYEEVRARLAIQIGTRTA